MKSKKDIYIHPVLENIRKIMADNNITQAAMAENAGTSPSQFSKILSGQSQLSLEHVSNIATNMGMNELNIFTYPDVYIKQNETETKKEEPVKAVLQIELQEYKKEQILKLVFGENNLKILNK